MVMDKSWNIRKKAKIMELCDQSLNSSNFAFTFYQIFAFLLTFKNFASLWKVNIFLPLPQNIRMQNLVRDCQGPLQLEILENMIWISL